MAITTPTLKQIQKIADAQGLTVTHDDVNGRVQIHAPAGYLWNRAQRPVLDFNPADKYARQGVWANLSIGFVMAAR